MKKFVVGFAKGFINIFLCKIFYRVHYHGLENLKNIDKCLICPNHSNTVEPGWIYAKVNDLCTMAKAELFENKFWNKFLTYFDVFPIRRGEKDSRSLIHAIKLFKNVNKRKLLVFPEGERLKKHVDRIPAKVGPAYIAYKAGVPIIPVYITKNVKLFSKVDVIFGKPVMVPDECSKDREKMQEFSDKLMDNIYNLKAQVK